MAEIPEPNGGDNARATIKEAIGKLTVGLPATDKHQDLMKRIVEHGRTTAEALKNSMPSLPKLPPGYDELLKSLKPASAEFARMQGVLDTVAKVTPFGRPDEISKLLAAAGSFAELSKRFSDPLTDPLSKINERIAEQARVIDQASRGFATRDVPARPSFEDMHIRMPPNPLIETNKRLARIEKRFEGVEKIALDNAKIANDLLAEASHFVGDFRKASKDSSKAGRIGIALGIFAIVVALVQFGSAQFWSDPADAAANRALRQELAQVRSVIARNDSDSVAILRDIKQLLAQNPAPATTKPQTGPTLPTTGHHREGGP